MEERMGRFDTGQTGPPTTRTPSMWFITSDSMGAGGLHTPAHLAAGAARATIATKTDAAI